MYATNIRELKKNPSAALRHARTEPVLILTGSEGFKCMAQVVIADAEPC